MRRDPGVYALVMRLPDDQVIRIGDFVNFNFPAGWYIYVGSAHGGGGLCERTSRHKRCDNTKKKHWHVDYLREYALIHEIWFSHSPRQREHDWAWKLRRWQSAAVPVPRFGALDCRVGCAAHLFHFDSRPSTAVFRTDLSTYPDHSPLYVEFVKCSAVTAEAPSKTKNELLAAYHRGRKYLELRRRADYDGLEETTIEPPPVHFGKDALGRQIIQQFAAEAKLPERELREDAKFAAAVENIVANCGDESENAFRVLLDSERLPTRKAIMQLSRTADTRQRYRIEGVMEGRMRSVAPQSGDLHHVYDTVAFSEVPKRLWRARGAMEKLRDSLHVTCCAATAKECSRLAQLCRKAALQLRRFVESGSQRKSVPRSLGKERISPILQCRDVRGKVPGYARLALSLTIKSVWDFPEMQGRGITPSAEERARTLEEVKRIVAAADVILPKLPDNGDSH